MCSLGIERHLVGGLMAAKGQATGEIEFVVDKSLEAVGRAEWSACIFGTCGLR